MRLLSSQGKSIIFITHKLKEVLAICSRVVVLRNGKVVGEAHPAVATPESLAAMMVGREVILTVEKETAQPKQVVLEIEGVSAQDDLGHAALNNVSLDVRSGEIVGVAGVQGNGQTELVEVLTGLRQTSGGRIRINGEDMTNASPRRVTDEGQSCHVPEDRHAYGMVDAYTVAHNLVLNTYHKPPFAQGVTVREEAINEHASKLVKEYDVRTPSVQNKASSLSGGNQQKMVVAREFSRDVKLLIAAQPTRGIDVGSIEFIHQPDRRQARRGRRRARGQRGARRNHGAVRPHRRHVSRRNCGGHPPRGGHARRPRPAHGRRDIRRKLAFARRMKPPTEQG